MRTLAIAQGKAQRKRALFNMLNVMGERQDTVPVVQGALDAGGTGDSPSSNFGPGHG